MRGPSTCFYFLAALLPLLLPLDWLVAALTAGAVHEACHILVLLACGGDVTAVYLDFGGCEIRASLSKPWQQFISIAAGPLGSLSLMLLSGKCPRLALFGLIQGIYNLFPVYPLDGGRLLGLVLSIFCPDYAEPILYGTGVVVCLVILLLGIWIIYRWQLGILAVFWGTYLIIKLFPRKIPCKAA